MSAIVHLLSRPFTTTPSTDGGKKDPKIEGVVLRVLSQPSSHPSSTKLRLYRNNLKNRNFDEEAHQNFDFHSRLAYRQWSLAPNQNSGAKPTRSKTDSSGYFGIGQIYKHKLPVYDDHLSFFPQVGFYRQSTSSSLEWRSYAVLFRDGATQSFFSYKNPSAWLDVEAPKPYSSKKPIMRNPLGLELPDEAKMIQAFIQHFPTYQEFMQFSLYDPNIGFYSSGKVTFSEKDFITCPIQNSPGFGKLIAQQAFDMWRSMRSNNDILSNEPFTLLELGAGNGRLAKDVLDEAKRQSRCTSQGREFYENLRYCIVERSEALRHKQANELTAHRNKVTILEGDARKVSDLFPPHSLKGLVFTNELPDAFPVHRAVVKGDGTLHVQMMIPHLLNCNLHKLEKLGIDVKSLQKKSISLQQKFVTFLQGRLDQSIILSKNDLKTVIEALDRKNIPSFKYIDFSAISAPDRFFPDVRAYRTRHQTSISRLEVPTTLCLNTGMREFIRGVANILDKGFVTTIDYGVADQGKHGWVHQPGRRRPRFFPENKTATRNVAGCDITTDIPWSHFKRELLDYLTPEYFGRQQALGDPYLQANDPVATSRWFQEQGFQMQISKTKNTKAIYRPPYGEFFQLSY